MPVLDKDGDTSVLAGSLLEVPLRIQCFNLINNMVFPLPNTTANRYCDYPGADTYLNSVTECKYDLFYL